MQAGTVGTFTNMNDVTECLFILIGLSNYRYEHESKQ